MTANSGASGNSGDKFLKFIVLIFKEILSQRKYYLLAVWVFLFVVGMLIFLMGTSTILPAIYMAF